MKQPLPYSIRRSARAKYLRVVVKPEGVEAVAPLAMAERDIRAFVAQKQDWIDATLQRLHQRQAQVAAVPALVYHDGALLPFQGREIALQVVYGAGKRLRIDGHNPQRLQIALPNTVPAAEQPALLRQAYIHWLKQQAQQQALAVIATHAPRVGLHPRSVRIKRQKSRWGSCGPQNDINLNVLLMLAPPTVFEYVVVHELCHIQHKHHAPAFWQLVAAHLPGYAEQRRWLKSHGHALMQRL